MCYDISLPLSDESVWEYFPGVQADAHIHFNYDTSIHVIAQSFSKKPVIYSEDGKLHMKEFEWGVIADYMNTPELIKKNRQWMCNAQSEKILDTKSYWYRIRKKRCLIPVQGFFEHREVKSIKNKIPYFIQLRQRPVFALAGLYAYSPIPDVETGEVRGTFTIVTRAANSIMQQIHNGGTNAGRMPLMLPKELESKWLQEDLTDEEIRELLNYEMPSEEMICHPVYSIRTTKERPDGKTKSEPYDWAGLPPLGTDEQQASLF